MLAHFEDYNDIVGDHPLNLRVDHARLNAYMLDARGEVQRLAAASMSTPGSSGPAANNDIMPSNVGLDGKIGGPDGKWYGGVYGWGFSPVVPQTGDREDRNRVPRCFPAFMNAYLLTERRRPLSGCVAPPGRRINAQARTIDGQRMTPTMHGADGWYSFRPGRLRRQHAGPLHADHAVFGSRGGGPAPVAGLIWKARTPTIRPSPFVEPSNGSARAWKARERTTPPSTRGWLMIP